MGQNSGNPDLVWNHLADEDRVGCLTLIVLYAHITYLIRTRSISDRIVSPICLSSLPILCRHVCSDHILLPVDSNSMPQVKRSKMSKGRFCRSEMP